MIDAVLRVFWQQGYGATAMADLAAAAGVQRGSLYNAYGGKEELLLRALDRYSEQQGGAVLSALAAPDPRRAIAGFLETHIERMARPENPAGCLMCQTALECGGRDPAPSVQVRRHFLRTEAALRDVLQRGRDRGLLPDDTDVSAVARFYLGVSRGMAVLHRVYGDLDAVRDMAREALRRLDDPVGKVD
ncbi:TetR/AcrR family transcriptional regulator [Algihabitans albus]|uniref:TetR/AcrR family transcriptional regulator n=1 Tax=Algihabitans albus TaxID=2164067 RepID=UPI0013C324DA|nr:TetR/AcrR family transcriptional regulator [Algihabitans albus]